MRKLFKIDFVRFCLVGTSGFILNFGLLTLLYKVLSLDLFVSQLIASEISLFSNFVLHHYWTYKHKTVTKSLRSLIWQFHMTSWVAIAGSALLVSLGVHTFKLNYVIALVVASIIALFWNFLWTKFVIWRHEHMSQDLTSTLE